MPPDLEVIYQLGETEQGFKMIVVQDLGVITADNDIDFVMLNAGELEELNDDDDEKI